MSARTLVLAVRLVLMFCNVSRERFAFTGIKDLIPQRKNESYEGFEDLIDRCNVWLRERTDIVVINMQSVIVQKNDGENTLAVSHFYRPRPH